MANATEKHLVVKIFVKSVQAPFLYSDLPVIKILPKNEILESPENFQKIPLGSGPFQLVKNSFHEILLKRNGPSKPFYPDFISFQIIRDSFTRTQKMLSGEADLAPSVIPFEKIDQFQRQPKKFRIISRSGLSTTYLLLNLNHDLLKNKNLREALSLSIHRGEIIKYKLQGYAVPARGLINPESYFFNSRLPVPKFDLEKAKQIIWDLGWTGKEIYLSVSNNQDSIQKARVLASQMSQTRCQVFCPL